jgi:uncharacterized delta-60 repeat protein
MSNYLKKKPLSPFLENTTYLGPTFTIVPTSGNYSSTATTIRTYINPFGEYYLYNNASGEGFRDTSGINGIRNFFKLKSDYNVDYEFLYNSAYSQTGTSFIAQALAIAESENGVYISTSNAPYKSIAGLIYLIKLNSDGTIDYSFSDVAIRNGTTALFNNRVRDIVVLNDGKILLCGEFSAYKGSYNYIVRLNIDGTVDELFSATASSSMGPNACLKMAVDSFGRIILSRFNVNDFSTSIIRLNSDGTLDSAFNSNASSVFASIFAHNIETIYIQGNGQILFCGEVSHAVHALCNVLRLNEDGTEDTTFTNTVVRPEGVRAFNGSVSNVVETNDGKLYFSGTFTRWTSLLANQGLSQMISFNPDLTLNSSFNDTAIRNGTTPLFNKNPASTSPVQVNIYNGELVVSGPFISYKGFDFLNYLIFLNPLNGELNFDSSKKVSIGGTRVRKFHNDVYSIVKLPGENSFIFGGRFLAYGTLIYSQDGVESDSSYSSSGASVILKLNDKGEENNTFSFNTTTTGVYVRDARFNSDIFNIEIMNTNKILVSGSFVNVSYFNAGGPSNISSFARLNSDGTIDAPYTTNASINSFSGNSKFNSTVNCSFPQVDGKVLVAGQFTNYGSTGTSRLVRLNVDGTEDLAFTTSAVRSGTTSKINSTVASLCQLADGRILFGGQFTNYNTTGVNRLSIVSSSGTITSSETSFIENAIKTGTTPKFNNNSILTIVQQTDGKILVGGSFTSYSANSTYNRILRFNLDGTLDLTFMNNTAGLFTSGTVSKIRLESTGHILICGSFLYNSPEYITRGIIRLNPDGTKSDDTLFNYNTAGVMFSTNDILKTNDNKYIVVGSFNNYTPKILSTIFMYWNFNKFSKVVMLDENGNIN